MTTEKISPSVQEKETGRIEAFSDGVFAIAITLLILDIKVPHYNAFSTDGGLFQEVLHLWPAFTAYFISFVSILIMWVSHHRLFTLIKRSNDTFLFLNGLVLFFVTFVPFPTALLSEYLETNHAQTAMAIYSGTYLCIAVVFNIMWQYAARGKRLLDKHANQCFVDNITKQYMFGPPLYLLAFIASFVNVTISVVLCLILVVLFAFTGSISRMMPCEVKI